VGKVKSGSFVEGRSQTGSQNATEADESSGEHRPGQRMKYSATGNGLPADRKPWGRGFASSDTRGNAERVTPGDEPGRVGEEGKALEGGNPMSVSGMKQGHTARRGLNPQGPEKGRRGMAHRVEPMQYADSTGLERWRGEKPQGSCLVRLMRKHRHDEAAPIGVSEGESESVRG
jgi:hypothetical protein